MHAIANFLPIKNVLIWFQIDAGKIQAQVILFPQTELYPIVFKPYIDEFSKDPFVPKDPWELIESGKLNDVPLIMGNNNDEGLVTATSYHLDSDLLPDLQKRWDNELGPFFITGRFEKSCLHVHAT